MRIAARLLVGPDVSADRFVTDDENVEPGEPADDLRRAEVLAQHGVDERPLGRTELGIAARPATALIGCRGSADLPQPLIPEDRSSAHSTLDSPTLVALVP